MARTTDATMQLVLAMLLAAPAVALDPQLRVSQIHKQYWGVEQGLPHSYVTSVVQGPDGFLLAGTDEGLARFDGVTFRPLAADAQLGLGQRWISALLTARDGSLWVGTFEGRLTQIRNGVNLASFDAGGSVFSLLEDGAGTIWLNTRNGVFRVSAGAIERVADLTAPLETSWNVLDWDQKETVWVVDSRGLSRCRGGSVQRRLSNSRETGEILTVLAQQDGALWIGTSLGLSRLSGQDASPVPVRGVQGPVVSLLEDHDGNLWAGTWGSGLYRVNRRGVERWTSNNGLPDDFIRTMTEDSEGNLWIGLRSGGLGRWKDTRIIPVGPAEGLAGDYATVVAADREGALWLGTWRGGLYRQRDGRLEPQPTPLPTLYFSLRALAFDISGHLWLGNWEGLFEFDGRRYRHYAARQDAPFRRVSAILFDRRGALWVGTTDQGLFRFDNGRPVEPAPVPLLPGTQITSLLEDSAGVIWVGTAQGVGRLEGNSFRPEPRLPAESVESLFEDKQHRIWAATARGSLFAVDGGIAKVLDRSHGLPGHSLYRVLEDDYEGAFWISSPRGIFELKRDALESVLAGRRPRLDIVSYGQGDGMRTIECHGLSQPAGWKAADGTLWFPTARGFVQVRPGPTHVLAPPRVRVEELRVASSALPLAGEVSLQPGARDLQIQFTGLRLGFPHHLRFRYRLGGFDPGWVDAGTQRTATYNQLPPGRHTFEVQARDPLGEWGPAGTLVIDQRPLFYQTRWFLLLLAVGLAGAVLAVYRWRVHTLRSRYAVVLEERNRIGREWHDTLVAGFSAISLQLEAAIARMREQPDRASEILDVTKRMVHHYRAEARRVIWDLRDNRPEDETLPTALRNALHRVTENRGIETALEVSGHEVELPVELQHNLLRICQEAMSNAARHGSPGRIAVRLVYGERELELSVEDDGAGFEAGRSEAVAGHFGLTVMEERARRHGGRLAVESAPGRGTKVKVAIPAPKLASK